MKTVTTYGSESEEPYGTDPTVPDGVNPWFPISAGILEFKREEEVGENCYRLVFKTYYVKWVMWRVS